MACLTEEALDIDSLKSIIAKIFLYIYTKLSPLKKKGVQFFTIFSPHTFSLPSFRKKLLEFLGSFNKKVYLRSRIAILRPRPYKT